MIAVSILCHEKPFPMSRVRQGKKKIKRRKCDAERESIEAFKGLIIVFQVIHLQVYLAIGDEDLVKTHRFEYHIGHASLIARKGL